MIYDKNINALKSLIDASPLEWCRGIDILAPRNHPLHISQCLHAVPESQFLEIHAVLSSAVPEAAPHGHHKCAHSPNNI